MLPHHPSCLNGKVVFIFYKREIPMKINMLPAVILVVLATPSLVQADRMGMDAPSGVYISNTYQDYATKNVVMTSYGCVADSSSTETAPLKVSMEVSKADNDFFGVKGWSHKVTLETASLVASLPEDVTEFGFRNYMPDCKQLYNGLNAIVIKEPGQYSFTVSTSGDMPPVSRDVYVGYASDVWLSTEKVKGKRAAVVHFNTVFDYTPDPKSLLDVRIANGLITVKAKATFKNDMWTVVLGDMKKIFSASACQLFRDTYTDATGGWIATPIRMTDDRITNYNPVYEGDIYLDGVCPSTPSPMPTPTTGNGGNKSSGPVQYHAAKRAANQ